MTIPSLWRSSKFSKALSRWMGLFYAVNIQKRVLRDLEFQEIFKGNLNQRKYKAL